MAITKFSFPTSITFGPGARREVVAHLKQQGVKRPLIVTDKGLASLPILKEFTSSLVGLAVATYSGVFGNPVKQQVVDGVKAEDRVILNPPDAIADGAEVRVMEASPDEDKK